MDHRTNAPASAPIGHPAAEVDLPADKYIMSFWLVSSMLVAIGLGSAAGTGGFLAGLGLSGLFFFLGVVIETAAERNRK